MYSNKLRHICRRFISLPNKLYFLPSRSATITIPGAVEEALFQTTDGRTKLDNDADLDELLTKVKIPYKLNRHPELTREFLRHRLKTYPADGMAEIKMEQFESILDDIDEPDEKVRYREVINDVVSFYNLVQRKSLFCPQEIPLDDMRRMLFNYSDYGGRIRYLTFLFIREFDVWRNNLKEVKRKEDKERRLADEFFENVGCFDDRGQLQYGYWRNTLFSRYFAKPIQQYSLHRLRQAQMYGQKLVVDCSYDEDMADYETISICRQISSIHHNNRFARCEPFHLMFTGHRETNRGYQHTYRMLKSVIQNPAYYYNFHKESYQDLLPNERLIYLSPDARQVMQEFDHNAVYIIGALVSKTKKSKKSFEKARAEGIETVRLPIHQYVRLKPLVKRVLSFQGVFKILLEMKEHGDWPRAFKAGIMSHKLIDNEEE